MPYQNFYEKLQETKKVFDGIGGSITSSEIEMVKEQLETLDQKEIDEEVGEVQVKRKMLLLKIILEFRY